MMKTMRKHREVPSDHHQWGAVSILGPALGEGSSVTRDIEPQGRSTAIRACRQSGIREGGNGMGLGEASTLTSPVCLPISCCCVSQMDKVKTRDDGLSVGCETG